MRCSRASGTSALLAMAALLVVFVLSSCKKETEADKNFNRVEARFRNRPMPTVGEIRAILGPGLREKASGEVPEAGGMEQWEYADGAVIVMTSADPRQPGCGANDMMVGLGVREPAGPGQYMIRFSRTISDHCGTVTKSDR